MPRSCLQLPREGGQGDGLELHQGKFTLDINKKIFTEVVRLWDRLSGEAVTAPSHWVFQELTDNAPRRMFNPQVALCADRRTENHHGFSPPAQEVLGVQEDTRR